MLADLLSAALFVAGFAIVGQTVFDGGTDARNSTATFGSFIAAGIFESLAVALGRTGRDRRARKLLKFCGPE